MLVNVRRSAILSVIVVASLVAFGCGGSDSSDEPAAVTTTGETSAAPSITTDELITLGDGICAEVNAAVGTISASDSADQSVKETQISGIYGGMADRLAALGVPTDGPAPTEVIDAARALADSSAVDGAASLDAFQKAAADYGFTDCAEAPAAPSGTGGDSTGSGGDSGGSAEPAPAPTPTPTPTPAPAPAPAPPSTGGGVAPSTGGGSGGGGGSSGGISPG